MDVAITRREYRFVILLGMAALAITSVPYLLGAALATEGRVFGGFVYAVEDCYSYLAKMRQGAEGAWLFHIAYTPEPHQGAFFFPFHLLLGKAAALLPGGDLTTRLVLVYHAARLACGLGLLLMTYRFLAEFTHRLVVRRVAWLMVTFGGGLGWLLAALGQSHWLESMPLDFILPEGFTFLVLYSLPHIALGRTLLLWGLLFLLKAWREPPSRNTHYAYHLSGKETRFFGKNLVSHQPNPGLLKRYHYALRFTPHAAGAGVCWLTMGLVVPFYVAVAWAVTGAACLALALRERRVPWREGALAGLTALISAPAVAYSAWVFTHDRVYATWAAQNLILSPHPLHYLAAYGVPLLLAAFAVREAWRHEGPAWLPLAWVAVTPLLIYLPFNLQRRLVEGAQVPLSLLAAWGLAKISNFEFRVSSPTSRLMVGVLLTALSLTNVLLVAGNSLALRGHPAPIYRDAGEIAALDWLDGQARLDDVVLAAYTTGNYLPARVGARAFVGHGPESVHAEEKKAQVTRFFGATTDDAWRHHLLAKYSVDYIFWGPAERVLGDFDPHSADLLEPIYETADYTLFEVVE